MKWDFVIFDFDGVLADSLVECCNQINRLRESHFPYLPLVSSREDLTQLYSGSLRTCLQRYGLSDAEARLFFDLHSEAMANLSVPVPLFSDVVEIFLQLPQSRRAIVTSAYSWAVRRSLGVVVQDAEELGKLVIIGREARSPKSEKFDKLCVEYGVGRERLLTVGDTASDVLYARDFGVATCVVGWGYQPLEYLLTFHPEYVAGEPPDLRGIIGL